MIDLNLDYRLKLEPGLDRYGIGVIGAGFIVRDCHLVAYRDAGFRTVAIASRAPERAREVAARHRVPKVYNTYHELLADPEVEVVDVAVPPDRQPEVMREVVRHADHVRGVLAQKPLAMTYAEAREIVEACQRAGIVLAVNQNMRHDQSVRALKDILNRGYLGRPVLGTIDMRAIPHWMPWAEGQRSLSTFIMSIHHLDTFRYWFGDPERVLASTRPDPRTKFPHTDGINLYILEYADGCRAAAWDDVWTGPVASHSHSADSGTSDGGTGVPPVGCESDIRIHWRVEGTDGLARGTIGWPSYPARTPSTLDFTTKHLHLGGTAGLSSSALAESGEGAARSDRLQAVPGPAEAGHHERTAPGYWFQPRWPEVWFPDAFQGTMGDLLMALKHNRAPAISGRDNLGTIALCEAVLLAGKEHRVVQPTEIAH